MTNVIETKICLYCGKEFTAISKRKYCDDTCRSRASYHRFTQKHPYKKTKPLHLQRWYQKRTLAKQKGREFTLTDLDIKRCLSGTCHYCSAQATQIDRYDNSKGYLPDNVVGSCARCNRLKSELHGDIFLEIMQKAAKQ